MKILKYKISLEDFKCRTPNTIPSIAYRIGLKDVEDVYTYNYNNIIQHRDDAELMLNYAFFPSDIEIPTSLCVPIIGDNCEKHTSSSYRIVSYASIKRIYYFMVDYYNKLTVDITCGKKVYSSVTQYNLYEEDKLDEELDETYASYGGKDMFDWLVKNIFLRFYIKEKYKTAWDKDFLSLGEVSEWYSWFQKRYIKYSGVTENDCAEREDCCDCEKYFYLGGNDFYLGLDAWLKNTHALTVPQTSAVTANKTENIVNTMVFSENNILPNANAVSSKDVFYDIETSTFATPSGDFSAVTVQNFSSFIEIPILIETTIDDMGEMSIFCNEWEANVDYSSKIDGCDYVTLENRGTVVTYNDKDWLLIDKNNPGYFYSSLFKETYFGNASGLTEEEQQYFVASKGNLYKGREADGIRSEADQWERYINHYYGEHASEFSATSGTFAYKDFKLVMNPTPKMMADYYEIQHSDKGYIFVNDELISAYKSDYIIYDRNTTCFDESRNNPHYWWNYNGKICLVEYVDEKNKLNPYVTINGKRYYGVWIKNGNSGSWKFNFSWIRKEKTCQESTDIIEDGIFVNINGLPFLVQNNSVSAFGDTYAVFHYYVDTEDGIIAVNNNLLYDYVGVTNESTQAISYQLTANTHTYGNYISLESGTKDTKAYSYYKNNDTNIEYIAVFKPYHVYNIDYVSGETDSKLSLFKDKALSCDDLGNELPGSYLYTSDGIMQPTEGTFLELPYKAGTVAYLSEMSSGSSVQYYWGNILTSVEYYYKDEYGKKVMGFVMDCSGFTADNNGTISYAAYLKNYYTGKMLSSTTCTACMETHNMITQLHEEMEKYISSVTQTDDEMTKRHGQIDDTIYCDFIYYCGAKIYRSFIDKGDSQYAYGVYKCNDRVEDNKINGVKYTETVTLEDAQCEYWLDDRTSIVLNYYKIIPTLKQVSMTDYNGLKIVEAVTKFETNISSFKKNVVGTDFFVNDNGFICLPNLREEYKFGISSKEKIDADIYISRGINSAMEKHLKLMETDTLDDILTYGNGYFNIIEN